MERTIYDGERRGHHIRLSIYSVETEREMFNLALVKIVVLSVLVAALALFFTLWQREVKAFATFKALTEKVGEAARDTNAAIELGNKQRMKEIENEIPAKIAAARAAAVRNYLARMPRVDPGSCPMPGADAGAEAPDGAAEEPVAAIVADAAEDAAVILEWQALARSLPNCLRVQ